MQGVGLTQASGLEAAAELCGQRIDSCALGEKTGGGKEGLRTGGCGGGMGMSEMGGGSGWVARGLADCGIRENDVRLLLVERSGVEYWGKWWGVMSGGRQQM